MIFKSKSKGSIQVIDQTSKNISVTYINGDKLELNTSAIFAKFCEIHGGFENVGLWQKKGEFYMVTMDHFYSFYMLAEPNNNVSQKMLNRWFERYLKAKECKVIKAKKRLHEAKNPQWCFVVTPPKN